MNFMLEAIDPQVVLFVAAIAVVGLSGKVLVRLLRLEATTVLAIVAIAILLNYGFGITPKQLWFEISHLPQDISQLIQRLG